MNDQSLANRLPRLSLNAPPGVDAGAVSWPAIIAGATGAAALSLILVLLGTGLGLSAVSPWADRGASATAFGTSTIAWLTLTQVASAGLGGYLAGRLRTRWADTHTDEVYFRDTAHGFLAWALATLLTAVLLTSAIGSILGTGVRAGAATLGAGAAGSAALGAAVTGSATLGTAPPGSAPIAIGTPRSATLPPTEGDQRAADDAAQVAAEAPAREAAARETADRARKASAYAALWLFVSLLAGAFSASLAATFGGRRRDQF